MIPSPALKITQTNMISSDTMQSSNSQNQSSSNQCGDSPILSMNIQTSQEDNKIKTFGSLRSFSFKLENTETENLLNDMNEFNQFYNNCS